MITVYKSEKHGKVIINVPQSFPWSIWFSTWATMQSLLKSKQCGELFDKICERDGKYYCDEAKDFGGQFTRVSSDAYASRTYAESLSLEDVGVNKEWLLKKMGGADCLAYRPSTNSIAILDASGELIISQYDNDPGVAMAGESDSISE